MLRLSQVSKGRLATVAKPQPIGISRKTTIWLSPCLTNRRDPPLRCDKRTIDEQAPATPLSRQV